MIRKLARVVIQAKQLLPGTEIVFDGLHFILVERRFSGAFQFPMWLCAEMNGASTRLFVESDILRIGSLCARA